MILFPNHAESCRDPAAADRPGGCPVPPPQRPLRLSAGPAGGDPATRVTGKWLFPEHLLDEWLEAGVRQGEASGAEGEADALFAAGSDDPAIEWLLDALAGGPLLFTATVGARRASELSARAAPTSPGRTWRTRTRASTTCPTSRATWAAGRLSGQLSSTGTSACWSGRATRGSWLCRRPGGRGLRFVNRQPGSGTRHFVDAALARAGGRGGGHRRLPGRGHDPLGGRPPGPARRGRRRRRAGRSPRR